MDVTGFSAMSGDCMSAVVVGHDFSLSGTTDDTGGGSDSISLVLYDGHGDAFAYIGIGVNVGWSGTVSGYNWNYPYIHPPKSRPFTMKIFDTTTPVGTSAGDLVGAQHGTIVDTVIFDPATYGVCEFLPRYSGETDDIPLPAFYDGRINDYDVAAPIAVYPHEVNGATGLIIYNVEGIEILVVSPQDIGNAPENPSQNILIASADGVSLYRIAGSNRGYWQINATQYNGKTYVLIFPELSHSGGYESYEL